MRPLDGPFGRDSRTEPTPSLQAAARPGADVPSPPRPVEREPRPAGSEPRSVEPGPDTVGNLESEREHTSVDLARLAWLGTVGACLIAVAILVLEGYYGYAAVTFAVAVSAALNLT
jgi:hypothetical protein